MIYIISNSYFYELEIIIIQNISIWNSILLIIAQKYESHDTRICIYSLILYISILCLFQIWDDLH